MSPELIAIIAAALSLAGLILTVTGRLSTRLTAVEKETARVAGALEVLTRNVETLTRYMLDRERTAAGE